MVANRSIAFCMVHLTRKRQLKKDIDTPRRLQQEAGRCPVGHVLLSFVK